MVYCPPGQNTKNDDHREVKQPSQLSFMLFHHVWGKCTVYDNIVIVVLTMWMLTLSKMSLQKNKNMSKDCTLSLCNVF